MAGEPAQLLLQPLDLGDVARKGLLGADRDRLGRELEAARVDPARPVAQQRAELAGQEAAQPGVVEGGELADRLDAGAPQPLLGPRPDAREAAHVERREERGLLPGRDDGDPARLAPVARDLRDDLAARDAERAREAGRAAHGRLHRLGHRTRLAEVVRHLPHVEVALVHPGPLDGRHDLSHGCPHGLRVLRVEALPRLHEHRLRAAPQCLGARHRRVDPERARDVVGGRDDSAPVRVAADDERPSAQLRRLELLHRREEGVEIEVRDDHESPRYTTRIGIPSRFAARGTVPPWTITENATTTKTIP